MKLDFVPFLHTSFMYCSSKRLVMLCSLVKRIRMSNVGVELLSGAAIDFSKTQALV